MAWSPQFAGFALTKAAGINIEDWSDVGPTSTGMNKKVAGGSSVNNAAIEGRRISMDLNLRAATASALEALTDALGAVLQSEESGVLRLNSARVIDAWARPKAIKPVKGSDGLRATLKVDFISEDPFWRSSAEAETVLLNSSASPLTATIAYPGIARSKVKLEVENIGAVDFASTTFTVRNLTTGKEFRVFKLSLGGGDTYHLDRDGQSYFDSPASADSSSPVRIDSVLFDLLPGNNDIEISHNMGSSSDINFKLSAFSRFPACGAYV